MSMNVRIESETWSINEPLKISRGTLSVFEVLTVRVEVDGHVGRGECCPTDRFGESLDSVRQQIEEFVRNCATLPDHQLLGASLPPGAARNALDCALWDLEAARKNTRVADLLRFPSLDSFETPQTISFGEPEVMAKKAKDCAHLPLLKLKLGGDRDGIRVTEVRKAAPRCGLIVDVNEGWTVEQLQEFLPTLLECGVKMIEQPLPADEDQQLAKVSHDIRICADESCHTTEDLTRVARLYDMINIKLDKCGGLTEGANLVRQAKSHGLGLMVGANLGTSLGVAATMAIAGKAELCDLDAALWLNRDHANGVTYSKGRVFPPRVGFWGDYRQAI